MKISTFSKAIVAISMLLMGTLMINAQETNKTVHIKIIEDGKVTKDTVYTSDNESLDIQLLAELEEEQQDKGKKHIVEKHVIVMSDSMNSEDQLLMEEKEQKNVRVVVNSGDEEGENSDIEEIWINGGDKPCHTIIIHEGECPGDNKEVNVSVIEGDGPAQMEHMTPPPAPGHGEVMHGNVTKKVIKTGDGKKVIIIETSEDVPHKEKGKQKK